MTGLRGFPEDNEFRFGSRNVIRPWKESYLWIGVLRLEDYHVRVEDAGSEMDASILGKKDEPERGRGIG